MGQSTWQKGSDRSRANNVAQLLVVGSSSHRQQQQHRCLDSFSKKASSAPPDLEKRFWNDGGKWKTVGSVTVCCSVVHCGAKSENMEAKFCQLPDDVMIKLAGCLSWTNLWAASLACKSWYQALTPLREAILFVKWGKRFKHGRSGVAQDSSKALDSFLKGAARGCAAAMIDAGLLLWEEGKREEGMRWYRHAAELGDPAGQCNLGLALLQAKPNNPHEAVKYFYKAANAGHVRAQYSLALCLQQGRGIERNPVKAAKWYLRAAEGGSTRAMYNTALCYLTGGGVSRDYQASRRWMKSAAMTGHSKAQFEYGLTLFAEGDGGLALAYLELATRAGETQAMHLRDVLVQQLCVEERCKALQCADKWQRQMSR